MIRSSPDPENARRDRPIRRARIGSIVRYAPRIEDSWHVRCASYRRFVGSRLHPVRTRPKLTLDWVLDWAFDCLVDSLHGSARCAHVASKNGRHPAQGNARATVTETLGGEAASAHPAWWTRGTETLSMTITVRVRGTHRVHGTVASAPWTSPSDSRRAVNRVATHGLDHRCALHGLRLNDANRRATIHQPHAFI